MTDIRRFRPSQRRGHRNDSSQDIIEGILYGDLAAATDELTGESTALAYEIKWESGTDFYVTEVSFTVTNRDTTLSILSGRKVTCARIGGEWRPLGGGGGSSSDEIEFTIDAWRPDDAATIGCDSVDATVVNVECGSRYQNGQQVRVWDIGPCYKFTLPSDVLVGLTGRARLYEWPFDNYPGDPTTCLDAPAPGECYLKVIEVCCAEELYAYA